MFLSNRVEPRKENASLYLQRRIFLLFFWATWNDPKKGGNG